MSAEPTDQDSHDTDQRIVHTPGPWDNGAFIVSEGDDTDKLENMIIAARNQIDHRGLESQANARLIAAAPELLAVVKRLQAAIGEFCCNNCISEEDLEDGNGPSAITWKTRVQTC